MPRESRIADILEWYENHPGGTSAECAAALGMHQVSVRRALSRARDRVGVPIDSMLHVCSCGNVHEHGPYRM